MNNMTHLLFAFFFALCVATPALADEDYAMQAWLNAGFNAYDAAGWTLQGFEVETAKPWKDAGFQADTAKAWKKVKQTPEQAREWEKAGVQNGFHGRKLIKAGVTLDEFKKWYASGVTNYKEIISLHKEGKVPGQAAPNK